MTEQHHPPKIEITRQAPGFDGVNRRAFLGWAGAVAVGGSLAATLYESTSTGADTRATLVSANGGTFKEGVQSFRTQPTMHPPQVLIETPYDGDLGGLIVTDCHDGPPQSGPLIVDQNGRVIWFLPMSPSPSQEHRAFNVRVWQYKGEPVIAYWEGAVVAGHGEGRYVLYNSRYEKIKEIRAHNGYQGDLHEFVITADDTALFTCYGSATGTTLLDGEERDVKYFYGVVQEVDIATGKLLFEWRSDHHVALSESYVEAPANGNVWDYFHINAITVDPSDHNLIVSSRNTWACYKLNRHTGAVIWKLGGKGGDFTMGAGTGFAFQHDVNMHPGGVMTLFDNGGGPPQEASHSKALVLSVDEAKRRVELTRAYGHDPAVYSDALGSVQPVAGGDYFVGWGRVPYFTRYDSSGKVLFNGHLTLNSNAYRAFLQSWEGMPTTGPDLEVVRHGSTATVYASWNGATQLGQWSVIGGPSRTALTELGVAVVHGFETAITVPDAPACLAVQGCNSAGTVLGTSRVATG